MHEEWRTLLGRRDASPPEATSERNEGDIAERLLFIRNTFRVVATLASALSERFGQRLDNGLGEIFEDGIGTCSDFDGGSHARLNFKIFIGPTTKPSPVGANTDAIIRLFTLPEILGK